MNRYTHKIQRQNYYADWEGGALKRGRFIEMSEISYLLKEHTIIFQSFSTRREEY